LNRLRQSFLTNPSFRLWKDVPLYGLQNEFSDHIHELLIASIDRLEPPSPETQEIIHEPLDQDSLLRTVDRETENDVHRLLSPVLWSKIWSKHRYLIIGCVVIVIVFIVILIAAL
jgi:hypothetical protein